MALRLDLKQDIGRLLVWKLDEPLSFYQDVVQLSDVEQTAFDAIKYEGRRREFLCVRMILQRYYPNNGRLAYHSDGRPFLRESNMHLSISHSKLYVAIFVSTAPGPGLDIETVSGRAAKIYAKFVGEEEASYVDKNDEKALTLVWSAKEALFKSLCVQGVDFRSQLKLAPFSVSHKGYLKAYYRSLNVQKVVKLHYLFLDGSVVVWGSRG